VTGGIARRKIPKKEIVAVHPPAVRGMKCEAGRCGLMGREHERAGCLALLRTGPAGKVRPPDREHVSYTGDVPGTLHQQPYITVYHG
jgi:hypothetical protein